MNQELQSKLIGLVTELEKGVEFGKAQAPVIVEQLLTYNLVLASVYMSIGLLLSVVFVAFFRKAKNHVSSSRSEDTKEILYVLSGFSLIVGTLLILIHAATVVKILTAPNLYVLDYLRAVI